MIPKIYKSILLIHANAVSDFRIDLAARHLDRAGFVTEVITETPYYKSGQYDAIICCRPGDQMIDLLHIASDAGRRVIVDLDDDFNSIPKSNPAFAYTGAGNANYLIKLNRLLQDERVVPTFASRELIKRYRVNGPVIENCWDEENPLWRLKKLKRKTINIGFSGTKTHREDFELVAPALAKLFKENKNLKWVCNLDEEIYKKFLDLPEEQKLFIPGMPYADYPLIFRYIDILIVPLRDTVFNRAKSDIKLLECGASRTPWVASNVPFYSEWGAGGRIVKDNDWEAPLRELINDTMLRKALGDQGYQKACTRTSEVIGRDWVRLMEGLLFGDRRVKLLNELLYDGGKR